MSFYLLNVLLYLICNLFESNDLMCPASHFPSQFLIIQSHLFLMKLFLQSPFLCFNSAFWVFLNLDRFD